MDILLSGLKLEELRSYLREKRVWYRDGIFYTREEYEASKYLYGWVNIELAIRDKIFELENEYINEIILKCYKVKEDELEYGMQR